MQTPEQFAAMLDRCAHTAEGMGERLTDTYRVADLIRARDAEVRADERAKALAGFEVEWGADLTPRPGKANPLGPPRPTTEKQARQEHAVNQAWFDDGDAAWCNTYEKSTLVRRLVGPWVSIEGESDADA